MKKTVFNSVLSAASNFAGLADCDACCRYLADITSGEWKDGPSRLYCEDNSIADSWRFAILRQREDDSGRAVFSTFCSPASVPSI